MAGFAGALTDRQVAALAGYGRAAPWSSRMAGRCGADPERRFLGRRVAEITGKIKKFWRLSKPEAAIRPMGEGTR
jgi:hypothetical protein